MSDNTTITAIDGRDALFGFILRPGKTETSAYVETFGSGIGRDQAARACLGVAIDCLRKAGAINTQIAEEFKAALNRAGICERGSK